MAATRPSAPDAGGPGELGASEFAAIAAIMQSDARIHLAPGKVTLVHSRLSRRVRNHGLRNFKDYVKLVHEDAQERAAMVVALTTNHTHFFREGHHFDHLRATAMPWLKEQAQKKPVRIWSAGCSSGEEVYSIAMCLRGNDRASASWLERADVKLLATDLSPPVVEAVRRGVYSATTVQPIPAAYRASWLKPQGADFAIADEVKAMVSARVLNLFEAWPMRQKYDVIFCRNVMIYFDDEAKAELEARLADLLVPGGYLYIGHSERLVGSAARQMKVAGQTIYRKEG
ncbi:MAG TPA: CheR family methyltransferase [Allosphingosinicella sp.]|jgi:chemotaxis protein methyltransferase CheR